MNDKRDDISSIIRSIEHVIVELTKLQSYTDVSDELALLNRAVDGLLYLSLDEEAE
jgi:hypothetical protein